MAEEPSLPYYLPIAGGRIIGFIPFPRVLVLCEMQSVSSRIWTRIAVSISYDDNHYTTGTSKRPFLLWVAGAERRPYTPGGFKNTLGFVGIHRKSYIFLRWNKPFISRLFQDYLSVSGAGQEPSHAQRLQKCFGPCRYSLKKLHFP